MSPTIHGTPSSGKGREGEEGRLQGDARESISQPGKGVNLTEELRAAPGSLFLSSLAGEGITLIIIYLWNAHRVPVGGAQADRHKWALSWGLPPALVPRDLHIVATQ